MNDNFKSDIQRLRNCINGYKAAQILMSAENTGIFSAISKSGQTLENISTSTGIEISRLKPIIHALENLGIIEGVDADVHFTNYGMLLNPKSECAQNEYLRYAASVKTLWNELDTNVTDILCTAENFSKITGKDTELTRRFLGAMEANAMPQAKWLVEHFAFEQHRVLDIGAGAGTYSIAVAQKCSSSRILAFDLPPVSEALAAKVMSLNLTSQVQVKSGNYRDSLPVGQFDDIFLFAVIHQESQEQVLRLLRTVKGMLNNAGRLFLTSFFVDDSHSNPSFAAMFAVEMLVMVPEGRVYSFRETEEYLKAAGFVTTERIDDIPGPATLYVAS